MGAGSSTGGIVKKSPLGCILRHWRHIGGTGGSPKKEDLIKYCNQWWPLYKLDEGEKWPINGTLNYDTLLQLMLFLRRERKWDEVMYADMFFTLRQHPEWQKKCGINLAPSDPLVLALEKDKRGKTELKRCCSACSIGQRCLKWTQEEIEEDLDLLTAPRLRITDRQAEARQERSDESEEAVEAESSTPISERTRSRQKTELPAPLQAPLRQAVGNSGPVFIKVPFSISDLNNWKLAAGNYREDPEKVASAFEMIVKTQNPD